jgi:hypothetical protein
MPGTIDITNQFPATPGGQFLAARFRHGVSTLYSGVAVTVVLVEARSLRRISQPTADCAELLEMPMDSARS